VAVSDPVNDDIDGRIKGLVISLADRLPAQDADLIVEMIDHNESLVGFEWLADTLCDGNWPLPEASVVSSSTWPSNSGATGLQQLSS
jgi:hypothetical protein